jgi:plasmid stabilization system protein ParE
LSAYVLSARARLDIQDIWNHIASENIEAADKVKHRLEQAMERLTRMPGMGHRKPDVTDPRYRFWAVYSYLIAYIPDTKPLAIVRVVHGARDFRTLFGNA